MPIYEYQCRKCRAHIEVFQKVSDKAPTKCRKCGGRLEKLISAPAIQFKGSGWYVTDYSDKTKKASAKERESSSTDDKKSDKKTKESSPSSKTVDKPTSKTPSGD